MADIFISFKTDDTPRVQAIYDGFRARGLTVFWSNDIPKGAPDYHAIIKAEIRAAPVVVVVWTHNSVQSHPVAQEGAQAERENKLFQVLLDDIEPIDFPFEVRFKAQKTMMLGWTGQPNHPEWIKLNSAIDARLGQKPGAAPAPAAQAVSQGGYWLDKKVKAAVSEGGGYWLDNKAKAFVTAAIGGRAPTASVGADAMPGANVSEWCADGKRGYTDQPVTEPAGPLDSASRTLRGGSWFNDARIMRAARRGGEVRSLRNDLIGFRCCA